MTELKAIITDLLEQFRGKKNIEALCDVLDKQVQDIAAVYDQIAYETSVETAVGKQLDRIGDIVGLTRAEAALLCGEKINFDVLEDEKYRKYLKYQSYRASNSCTYYDLINALKMVWGDSGDIHYIEDAASPATIVLDLSAGDDGALHLGDIPAIKPAGVDIEYKVGLMRNIRISHEVHYYLSGIACGTHYCGTYPPKRTRRM